jgi:hypothetical protein
MNSNNELSQNIARLIESNEISNIALALQLLEGMPELLDESVFSALLHCRVFGEKVEKIVEKKFSSFCTYDFFKKHGGAFYGKLIEFAINEIAMPIIEKCAFIEQKKGKNSLYAFLRKNNIEYEVSTIKHGLETSKKAREAKKYFERSSDGERLRLHYYSVQVKARSGWKYNVLRSLEITLK